MVRSTPDGQGAGLGPPHPKHLRTSILLTVIAAGLALGAGARGLWQADLAQPPGLANNGQWGVIHLRVDGDSGTLTQLTRTQLVLPYTDAAQARKGDSRG